MIQCFRSVTRYKKGGRMTDYPEDAMARRSWLLVKALEAKQFPEALDLAWAAENFVIASTDNDHFPPTWRLQVACPGRA
jgi:hypothetical protein